MICKCYLKVVFQAFFLHFHFQCYLGGAKLVKIKNGHPFIDFLLTYIYIIYIPKTIFYIPRRTD